MLQASKSIGFAVAVLGLLAGTAERAIAQTEYVFADSYYHDNDVVLDVVTTTGSEMISTHGKQGFWSNLDPHATEPRTNYMAGQVFISGFPEPILYNDFFIFNLSALSGETVTSATLSLRQFTAYSDTNQPITYYVGGVDSSVAPPSALLDVSANPNVGFYNALGAGNYGSVQISPGTSTAAIPISLDSTAISDLNTAISAIGMPGASPLFTIGGTLFPQNAAVPEPSTLVLGVVGAVGGLGSLWLRGRRAA